MSDGGRRSEPIESARVRGGDILSSDRISPIPLMRFLSPIVYRRLPMNTLPVARNAHFILPEQHRLPLSGQKSQRIDGVIVNAEICSLSNRGTV